MHDPAFVCLLGDAGLKRLRRGKVGLAFSWPVGPAEYANLYAIERYLYGPKCLELSNWRLIEELGRLGWLSRRRSVRR